MHLDTCDHVYYELYIVHEGVYYAVPYVVDERLYYVPYVVGERVYYVPYVLGEHVRYVPYVVGKGVRYVPYVVRECVYYVLYPEYLVGTMRKIERALAFHVTRTSLEPFLAPALRVRPPSKNSNFCQPLEHPTLQVWPFSRSM
jgi:hypothetical protein